MALVVELGTVTPGANSYATVEEAEEYFRDHYGATEWDAASYPQKVSALLYGTRYVDNLGGFIGVPVSSTQPLLWPRTSFGTDLSYFVELGIPQTDLVGNDYRVYRGIPTLLKEATCEAALSHLRISINETAGGDARVKSTKVGDLEIAYAVKEGQTPATFRKYIRKLLRPLLINSGGVSVFTMVKA